MKSATTLIIPAREEGEGVGACEEVDGMGTSDEEVHPELVSWDCPGIRAKTVRFEYVKQAPNIGTHELNAFGTFMKTKCAKMSN